MHNINCENIPLISSGWEVASVLFCNCGGSIVEPSTLLDPVVAGCGVSPVVADYGVSPVVAGPGVSPVVAGPGVSPVVAGPGVSPVVAGSSACQAP
ncbi:hypothetical protein PoB_003158500 [Plakobranchus ocellatus]|uniref:Uncharacterized protein n=1 Tax=Plakobranchus ocellatus TaxID=259542 RepID=A0AAV4AA85_9GAST|nr:hypothetical protein PoB_003158500 [Plakobranchus ocellatus]